MWRAARCDRRAVTCCGALRCVVCRHGALCWWRGDVAWRCVTLRVAACDAAGCVVARSIVLRCDAACCRAPCCFAPTRRGVACCCYVVAQRVVKRRCVATRRFASRSGAMRLIVMLCDYVARGGGMCALCCNSMRHDVMRRGSMRRDATRRVVILCCDKVRCESMPHRVI